jgi:hypothetical protein
MLIKEIVTEAPVGFFKGVGKAIRSKLPGGQAAAGEAQLGVAANAIFKAVQQWAGSQQIDINQITPDELRQCTVFPSEKEQAILDKAMKGHPPNPGPAYSKKDLGEVILTFVKQYKSNSPDSISSGEPTTHVEVNTAKGRYTFNPGKGWTFKGPKTTGLGTAIPANDPRISKLNAEAKKQAEQI